MSIEGDIHSALMARAETLSGYPLLWPRKGGDQPAEEHVRIRHLPNDSNTDTLSGKRRMHQGFMVLTLVSPLGAHEAETRDKAGSIAEHFPLGLRLTRGLANVTLISATIRPGREEAGRWETPIRIGYRL